uniref:FXYD domain-containing ion transport regulator n=1 Tax=Sinocyclocheilus anshuiensis TaxID=1608454 RepID=A0A671S8C7_9TELE
SLQNIEDILKNVGNKQFWLIFDYELIRRGGLIFAAVLFCLGMAIIFSECLLSKAHTIFIQ